MKQPNFEENSNASTALTDRFRIFVFLSFCHCVFLFQFVLVHFFSSTHFISVHRNLLGSLLSPFLLYFCIFVFCHKSQFIYSVHIISYQFIAIHLEAFCVIFIVFSYFRLSFFLSFCLSVIATCQFVLVHLYFTSVHLSSWMVVLVATEACSVRSEALWDERMGGSS